MNKPLNPNRAAPLLLQHYAPLYGYIYACVGRHADAEDLLQEVSLVVTTKFDRLETEAGFLPWAREIARREVLSFYKRQSRSMALFDPATIDLLAAAAERLETRTNWPDRHTALTQCLDELPPTSREVVCLRYDDRVANVEAVAQQIGRTVSATYGLLKRVRMALRNCIERRLAAGATS